MTEAARSHALIAAAASLIKEHRQEADIARLQLKVLTLRVSFFEQSVFVYHQILFGPR
jgi:hypothetical protein